MDISGRVVKAIKASCGAGNNNVKIDTRNLKRGVYFVNVKYTGFNAVKKVEIIR